MKKTTYSKLLNCVNAGVSYANLINGKENKLTYALRKIAKLNKEIIEEYTSLSDDLKIKHASVDEKKNLIVNNGQFCYTKENQKLFNDEVRTLNNKEIEVHTFIVNLGEVPSDVPVTFRDVFEGLVIPESE